MSQFKREQLATGWSQVPNGLWTLSTSAGARIVLGWLWSHTDQFLASLTVNKARRILGTSRVSEYLEQLEQLGFITIDRTGQRGSWSFLIHAEPWMKLCDRSQMGAVPVPDGRGDRSHMGAPISARVEDHCEKTTSEDQNENAQPVAANLELQLQTVAPPSGERDRFEEFWDAYPRAKVGKAEARTAWAKAIKKTKPDVIIKAAVARGEWYAAARTPNDKRPHASTWLNAERWDDEIEPVPEQAAASAAQKLADHDQRERGELKAALDRHDQKLATRIVIDHAEARGDLMFVAIAKRLLDGKSEEMIQAVVTRDGEPVSTDDIAHVRSVLDEIEDRCKLSPQLER